MPTGLEALLASIDPERTVEQTFGRANHALNTFPVTSAVIDEWDEFRHCMVEFLRHVESCTLNLREAPPMSSDFYWSRCVRLLIRLYGINGEKAAFEMARTGNEGGLYAALKAVAMKVAEECSASEVAARVSRYWEDLSADERLSAAREYLDMYGHLLPSELTEGSAARIMAGFPKVLEQHPSLLRKLRGIGR